MRESSLDDLLDEIIQSMKNRNIEELGTWPFLDIDGDGQSENVSLMLDESFVVNGKSCCSLCQLFVWDDTVEQDGDMIECGVYGGSLDGASGLILRLMVVSDGLI